MHRGLRCMLHVCLLKSSISNAVVALSIVTGLTAGGGGTLTEAHSSMIVATALSDALRPPANAASSTIARSAVPAGLVIR